MAKFQDKLLEKIKHIIRDYSRAACELVRQEWNYEADDDRYGNAEISYTVEDAQAAVVAVITAIGQKAWILEYGKGSLMEKSAEENPFLEDYISGKATGADGLPRFNQRRIERGFAILGRPKGRYLDLDDVEHFSTGTFDGWSVQVTPYTPMKFGIDPAYPRKVIKTVLFGKNDDGIIAEMNKEIEKAVLEIAAEMLWKQFPKKLTIHKE